MLKQLRLITHRMSKPHIPAKITDGWRSLTPLMLDVRKDDLVMVSWEHMKLKPDKLCALVGCNSFELSELGCGGCLVNRYCSEDCQKRCVYQFTGRPIPLFRWRALKRSQLQLLIFGLASRRSRTDRDWKLHRNTCRRLSQSRKSTTDEN